MRIVAVYGSGRTQGNGAFLVERAAEQFQKAGAEVKKYDLTAMAIHPCTGCMACRKADRCAREDDMARLLEDVIQSDFVIFSFPVYMFEAAGVFRMMLNRMFPMLEGESKTGQYQKRYPGKRCMVIMTQGAPSFLFGGVLRSVKWALKTLGFRVEGTVRCSLAFEPDSAEKDPKVLSKVHRIRQRVLKEGKAA